MAAYVPKTKRKTPNAKNITQEGMSRLNQLKSLLWRRIWMMNMGGTTYETHAPANAPMKSKMVFSSVKTTAMKMATATVTKAQTMSSHRVSERPQQLLSDNSSLALRPRICRTTY